MKSQLAMLFTVIGLVVVLACCLVGVSSRPYDMRANNSKCHLNTLHPARPKSPKSPKSKHCRNETHTMHSRKNASRF